MATIKKLTDWKARRVSASLTITGLNAKGEEIKITGVPVIEAGRKGRGPIVADKAGTKFELVSS
ncbi:hypothetical protein EN742_00830 [Mesorhizobium sp. M4A.F.Ca.ET.020.02.1.1]|uniref:hypothetical protein n=1 Tax=Mesorhizobium sp. M4A.F.Ca.ET.020.02.1.1 TaxID=2496652 RepID=UPI000FD39801|nr:hypothetical protein [Mesorhizobium sp. M4A.F.Ca.ET.020.02.1.1]RVD44922.1 hypothetical protein EN742_00830 [Mesorhizobium sp. M4A.F.Ca.ET.020.02.1.1]